MTQKSPGMQAKRPSGLKRPPAEHRVPLTPILGTPLPHYELPQPSALATGLAARAVGRGLGLPVHAAPEDVSSWCPSRSGPGMEPTNRRKCTSCKPGPEGIWLAPDRASRGQEC